MAIREKERSAKATIESILRREDAIMAAEYHEGPEALKRFEDGMTKLFQAPKDAVKENPKPSPKPEKTSKD